MSHPLVLLLAALLPAPAGAGTAGLHGRTAPPSAQVAPVQLVGDTAALVRSLLSMDLGFAQGGFTAPSAAAAAPGQPASLTLTPADHALLASYLLAAEQVSPAAVSPAPDLHAAAFTVSVGQPAGIPLLMLQANDAIIRPAAEPAGLGAGGSFQQLALVVETLRESARRGPMSREEALEVSRRIFDQTALLAPAAPLAPAPRPPVARREAEAEAAPVAAIPPVPANTLQLVQAIPPSLLRSPEAATLTGNEGDKTLNATQIRILEFLLSGEAARGGPLQRLDEATGLWLPDARPVAERLLTVLLELQGFTGPVPLSQWLGVAGERRLGPRTDYAASLTGSLAALNEAIAAANAAGAGYPPVSLEGFEVLEDVGGPRARVQAILTLNAAKTPDLRGTGIFVFNGRAMIPASFIARTKPHELAAALLAMALKRAGLGHAAAAEAVGRLTAAAFTRTFGQVTVANLTLKARDGALRPNFGPKRHVRTSIDADAAPAPVLPPLRKRLAAGALALLRTSLPYLPAILLGAYVLAAAIAATAMPGALEVFLVLALALAGRFYQTFRPLSPNAANAPPASAEADGDAWSFTLQTAGARFARVDELFGEDDDKVVRLELVFDLPNGTASVGIDHTEENIIDIVFSVPDSGRQSYFRVLPDKERLKEKHQEQLMPLSAFLQNFWTDLQLAARRALNSPDAERRKKVRTLLREIERRIAAMEGGGGDSPVAN